ncbi:hypothetical protein ISS30_09980, partial [bacterium]|nr:hypothetical protein [bacterium]
GCLKSYKLLLWCRLSVVDTNYLIIRDMLSTAESRQHTRGKNIHWLFWLLWLLPSSPLLPVNPLNPLYLL